MPTVDAPLLDCRDLVKSFSGVPVLKRVSLQAFRGRVLGVVGENGAGKSTLMNLVGGVHKPDAGAMLLDGAQYAPQGPLDAARKGIAFVHQELNLFTNLSIADNIFIAESPSRRNRERTRQLLARLELDLSPDTIVETLSQGERQLVEIAKALHIEARLIIFDEPTTSLPARESARLFGIIERLRAEGIAAIYISHALEDVLRLCDEVVVLRDGEVVGGGAAREHTRGALIAMMVGRAIEQLYPERAPNPGPPVLEASGLAQPGVLADVSFRLHRGEILGVSGLMGSGRSEMARILFGLDPCRAGALLFDGRRIEKLSTRARTRLGMAFLTESRRDDGLFMSAPIRDNLEIVHREPARAPEVAQALRIACANLDRQPVRQLSGGNQQKVALGKWLVRAPRVLILDEPTRGIDVGAKYEIYRLMADLAAQGVALLVISSEIEELTGLCDRILAVARGEIRREFARPFDREAILGAALT